MQKKETRFHFFEQNDDANRYDCAARFIGCRIALARE